MEKACVTQYDREAENNNLPYIGYDKYRVRMDTTGRGAYVRLSKEGELILLDGKWSDNNTRKYTLAANTSFYPNKSNITPDVQDQAYVTILIPRYTCYCYGNLCPLEGENIVEYFGYEFGSAENAKFVELYTGSLTIDIPYGSVKIKGLEHFPFAKAKQFDIHDLEVLGEPLDISMLGVDGLLLTCQLGRVANLTGSLNNIGFSNISTVAAPATKDVSIDVVTFVQNARTAGRTTGSVNITYAGSITVKANGVTLDIPVETNNTLAWTADSITFRGEPIS